MQLIVSSLIFGDFRDFTALESSNGKKKTKFRVKRL